MLYTVIKAKVDFLRRLKFNLPQNLLIVRIDYTVVLIKVFLCNFNLKIVSKSYVS